MSPVIIILIILLFYYLYFLWSIKRGIRKIKRENSASIVETGIDISLIVAFRNEAKNLGNLINDIVSLDIEGINFEVIFVNDHSDDDWGEFRHRINSEPNWIVLELGNGMSGKKASLSEGIKKAKGEIILVTDADCRLPKQWTKLMIGQFTKDTGFVAGAVKYKSYDSFFARIQALEFGGLILAGAGLIGIGEPVICSAASMAFRRELFFKVDGYRLNKTLSSGDDEFLMRSISRLGIVVKYLLVPEGVVETDPNRSIGKFVEQRSRWASKGLFYEDPFLIIKLSSIFLFYLSLILSPVIAWVYGWFGVTFLLVSLLLKGLTEYFILLEGEGLLYERVDFSHFITAELLHIPYIVFTTISGALGGFVWKGRKLSR